jgi:hypothetical protein
VGCSPSTVGSYRSKLTDSGVQVGHLNERQAPDGKRYPATQPARPTADVSREAELIGRAHKLGYVVTPVNGGTKGYRISEGLIPMGGAKDLDEIEALLAPKEQRVAENMRLEQILLRTPLPPGWVWQQVNGDIRVVRAVNSFYSPLYQESQIADAVAWAEMHSADPIAWDHLSDKSVESRIYSCKNYPQDPGSAAALAKLLKGKPAPVDDDEEEDYDDEEDEEEDEEEEEENLEHLAVKKFRNVFDIKDKEDSIWNLSRGHLGHDDYIIKQAKH